VEKNRKKYLTEFVYIHVMFQVSRPSCMSTIFKKTI